MECYNYITQPSVNGRTNVWKWLHIFYIFLHQKIIFLRQRNNDVLDVREDSIKARKRVPLWNNIAAIAIAQCQFFYISVRFLDGFLELLIILISRLDLSTFFVLGLKLLFCMIHYESELNLTKTDTVHCLYCNICHDQSDRCVVVHSSSTSILLS